MLLSAPRNNISRRGERREENIEKRLHYFFFMYFFLTMGREPGFEIRMMINFSI